jgi:hypothetical protein
MKRLKLNIINKSLFSINYGMTVILTITVMFALSSCTEVKPTYSGFSEINVFDTKVNLYYSSSFSKSNNNELMLAIWDNTPIIDGYTSNSPISEDQDHIRYSLTKENPNLKFYCFCEFDKKTGKGIFDFAGEKYDISNGRLFLINTLETPIKVIQVNEPFNNFFPTENYFKLLAKNNKKIADFVKLSTFKYEK